MKKMLATVTVAALSLMGASAALADHRPGHPAKPPQAGGKVKTKSAHGKPDKVTVCHRTGSTTNPHRTIKVSEKAWENAHEKHGDTLGACTNGGTPRGAHELDATLTAVSGATGSGTADVDVRLLKNKAAVCYTLQVTGVDATAAHIHTSVAQTIGDQSYAANAIVVPLKTPNDSGLARGCESVTRAVGDALLANPGNFYVNVHSTAYPAGQVQGALST